MASQTKIRAKRRKGLEKARSKKKRNKSADFGELLKSRENLRIGKIEVIYERDGQTLLGNKARVFKAKKRPVKYHIPEEMIISVRRNRLIELRKGANIFDYEFLERPPTHQLNIYGEKK